MREREEREKKEREEREEKERARWREQQEDVIRRIVV
jgi:hypothetical protein